MSLKHPKSYDYIVVGGGTAGSVVAGKLAQETDARVLLLEAGKADRNPLISIPAGFAVMIAKGLHIWPYLANMEKSGKTLQTLYPAGKGLGGGSTINAMAYVRGQDSDYEHWNKVTGGNAGWDAETMRKYHISVEDNQRLNDVFHGAGGPLGVSDPGYICELSHAFVRSAQNNGLPFNADYNGANQFGAHYLQLTMRNRKRCSASKAFLHPAMSRKNLHIQTGCLVSRLIIENGKVTGVEYRHKNKTEIVKANSEVVLSAGAIQSPKILMLSGIGPANTLSKLGIEVKLDQPEVGKNLQDHGQVPVIALARGPYGYHGHDRGFKMIWNGIQYILNKSGPASSNGVEAGAFLNVDNENNSPNIQVMCTPLVSSGSLGDTNTQAGITLDMTLIKPKSRGSVVLNSADPSAFPEITPKFLDHPDDLNTARNAVRRGRELVLEPEFQKFVHPAHLPDPKIDTDKALNEYCHNNVATVYHPVGTCRMGADDNSVVDTTLKLRGLEGLRIVDASVMPNITSGNTNAPTIALAARAVDIIKSSK